MKKILVQAIMIYIICISNYMSTLTAAVAKQGSEVIVRSSVKSGKPEVNVGEGISHGEKASESSASHESTSKSITVNQAVSHENKAPINQTTVSMHSNTPTVDLKSITLDENVDLNAFVINDKDVMPTGLTGSVVELSAESQAVSHENKEPINETTISEHNNDQVANLDLDVDLNSSTSQAAVLQEGVLFSEPTSSLAEKKQTADLDEGPSLFDDTGINLEKKDVTDLNHENDSEKKQTQTQDIKQSVDDKIQTPDEIIASVMINFVPKGEKMLTMGQRADGSNYMITAKTTVNAKNALNSAKIDTITVLEFGKQGAPLRDSNGLIKTTSLPMSKYQSQLSVPRENLLKQAQQDLAKFEQPDNLQQKTDEYQKQQAAYNKAKETRDNLEKIAQNDPSFQAAYDKSKEDCQVAQEACSMQDPEVTLRRLNNKVNQYSDKQTRIARAEKNLQDAKQSSADITQKRKSLEAAIKNESNAGKRAQISNDLTGVENTEYFANQRVKDAYSKLQYTKNSTYSIDTADFQAVFDDVTTQFVNDPAVMESLKTNKDYQTYRDQVTKEIYKPAQVGVTLSGIKTTINFMADVDLGKAFKSITPSVDPGKVFRTLATDVKYAYLGKSRYQS